MYRVSSRSTGRLGRNNNNKVLSKGSQNSENIVKKKIKGQSRMTLNPSPGTCEGDSIFCIRDMLPSMPLDRVSIRTREWPWSPGPGDPQGRQLKPARSSVQTDAR